MGEYLLLKYSPVFKRRYTADGDLMIGCTIGCRFCYYRMIDATAPYIGTGILKGLASPPEFAAFVEDSKLINPGDLVILGARGDASMYEAQIGEAARLMPEYKVLALRRAPFNSNVVQQLEDNVNLYYGTTVTPNAYETGTPVSERIQLDKLRWVSETGGRGVLKRISVEVGPITPENAAAAERVIAELADIGFESFIYRGISVGSWGIPLDRVVERLGNFAYVKPAEKKEYFYALKNYLPPSLEERIKSLAADLGLRAYRHTGAFYAAEWRIPVALNRRNRVRRDLYEARRGLPHGSAADVEGALASMGYTVTGVEEVDDAVYRVATVEPVTEDVAMSVGARYGVALLAENYMLSPDIETLKMYIRNGLFAVRHSRYYRWLVDEVNGGEAGNNTVERTTAL